MTLYPLLLRPALHTRVWGGRRLETIFHKTLPSADPYGEAWEMHDTAVVANGPYAGQPLAALLASFEGDLVGDGNDPALGFPLLVKLLDASDWLSVQVHPNDEQAREFEGEARGKTEAWYVLAAEPGARLVIGLIPGTSRAAMAEAIRAGTLDTLLVYADVRAGDVLNIPAGTVHALGPGLLIYEIQQSSDLTYRLYDWGRMGLDGKPRTLHIEKGVAVSNLDRLPPIHHVDETRPTAEVVRGPYFTTVLHRLTEPLRIETGGRFHIVTCTAGSLTIESGGTTVTLDLGQTALIPAALPGYTLAGTGAALRSSQP